MEFTNIVTLGDDNEVLMENINLCNALESGIVDTMTMCTFDRSFTTPRKVIEDPARYAVSFDSRIPCKDIVVSVDEWGNPTVSTFAHDDALAEKSVGYIYHGHKQILDPMKKDPVVADVKPWFPAVDKYGTTLTDIIDACRPAKSFKTSVRKGNVTVKILDEEVKGTIKAKLASWEPSKGYRTVFDKLGFAMKLIYVNIPTDYQEEDCTIMYTNDPALVEGWVNDMSADKLDGDCRAYTLVNNGNGTFYNVYDVVVKK